MGQGQKGGFALRVFRHWLGVSRRQQPFESERLRLPPFAYILEEGLEAVINVAFPNVSDVLHIRNRSRVLLEVVGALMTIFNLSSFFQ